MVKKNKISIENLEASTLCTTYSPDQKATNTGSPESQIAFITQHIQRITSHLQAANKKDISARHGLNKLVSKRKKLLKYLKRQNIKRYQTICSGLQIRK